MRTLLVSAPLVLGCLVTLLASGCEAESPEPLARHRSALELSLSPLEPLQPSDASPGDRFGLAVSASHDWLLAARYVVLDDAVELLAAQRTTTGWAAPAQLVPTDVNGTRWLGTSVAVHQGDVPEALVGTGQTDGSVLVFDLQSGAQTGRLDSPGSLPQRFGASIAVRNSWLAVGDYLEGPSGDEPGAVHLYHREDTGWSFRQSIGPQQGVIRSRFGRSVALSDGYLAVGAPEQGGVAATAGAVHVFALEGGVWTFQQSVTATVPQSDAQFGYAVALSDDALFVVSRFDNTFKAQAGAVYGFERTGSTWSPIEPIGAEDPQVRGGFGESLAFDGELLGIGEHGDPGQSGADLRGAVSTYHRVGAKWELLERVQPETSLGSSAARFGHAVALGDDRLVVGAPDDVASSESGFVASWEIIHTEINGACADGVECASGHCVDGVCCDTPCDGTCVACSAAKKGHGVDGACEPILEGLDPDDECPADPSSGNACAPASACTGDASCGCVVPGTLQCSSDEARVDESGNEVGCAPYRCRANTCLTACTSAADCAAGARCSSDHLCSTPSGGGSSDSGGCAFAADKRSAPGSLLGFVLALIALGTRRRRSIDLS